MSYTDKAGSEDEIGAIVSNVKRQKEEFDSFFASENKKQKVFNILADDSIVKIVNSLKNENGKFLNITNEEVNVFQFPRSKIYVRDCYETMFRNICKILNKQVKTNVIITGQPGIGKSSFLYVLLYFLNENLRNEWSDDLKDAISKYDEEIKNNGCYKIPDNANIRFKCIIPKDKDIFVYKNKKGGTESEMKVYLFVKGIGKDGKEVFKLKRIEDPGNIKDSIIIVDTYSQEFDKSNIIISISAPDSENNKHYFRGDVVRLYFDSFNDKEINEWFDNCIDINKDDKFDVVCKRYGNTPRQIYFHYLYKENYHKDYWEYYKVLIDSVVGSTGYCRFVKNYMKKENIENRPLSNIILKYDMKLKWNDKLECNISIPKDYLKFVSESVESYVTSKFFPPENERDLEELEKYSKSVNDKYIERMAMKQRVAYNLSTGVIKINGKDDAFEISDEMYVPVCYPVNGKHMVYFILKEDNYFDLIINGIFVKILTREETFDENDETEKRIKQSIIEYSKNKSGSFKYVIIKDEKVDGRTFTIDIDIPTTAESRSDNEAKIKDLSYHIDNIYVDGNHFYIMRDFYYKVFNTILNGFDGKRQKNYLIFGTERIGKTTLAEIINDYLKLLYPELQVFLINNISSTLKELNEKKEGPYIVISDERAIGEDEYPDAKMIILIGNASDEKIKTFQSKRLPLIMYIPPFTKKEIVGVLYVKNPFIVDDIKQIISERGIIWDETIGKAYKDIFYDIESSFISPENSILRYPSFSGYNEKLSLIIHDYIKLFNIGYEIITIKKQEELNGYDRNKPYVVISNGIEIDKSIFPNAKITIIIEISSGESSKTDENNKVSYFCYYNKEVKKENYDKNADKDFKIKIKKYEDNYPYYGGVIGNFCTNKDNIEKKFKGMKKEELLQLFEDVMRGNNVSPLTKRDYNNILIYTTYENDITKAGPLKFLSKEIEKIAFSSIRKLYKKDNEVMFNLFKDHNRL